MTKQLLLTGLVIGNLLASVAMATNLTVAEQIEIVAVHNNWRSSVQIPSLQWSDSLAATAQAWANQLEAHQACKPQHSRSAGLGENLFWASAMMYSDGSTEAQVLSAAEVVNNWGDESKDYRYSSNSCAAGKVCGHYTQIIWANTTEVGCGKALCADNSQVWVCNYSPAGNYIGEKPY